MPSELKVLPYYQQGSTAHRFSKHNFSASVLTYVLGAQKNSLNEREIR